MTPFQNNYLRLTALKCICTIMNSLEAVADKARQSQGLSGAPDAAPADAPGGAGNGAGAGGGTDDASDVGDDDHTLQPTASSASLRGDDDDTDGLSTGHASSAGKATSVATNGTGEKLTLAAQHDLKKKNMAVLERAAVKFAMKPRKGIEFLQKLGRCGTTPQEIAQCLYQHRDILDKTACGDYLGGEKQINKDVMHAYIDLMDFHNMRIEGAIRMCLAGFRLPGEAQKIDRIMEKLAERFCSQNPGVFNSPDGAFVLSYRFVTAACCANGRCSACSYSPTRLSFAASSC